MDHFSDEPAADQAQPQQQQMQQQEPRIQEKSTAHFDLEDESCGQNYENFKNVEIKCLLDDDQLLDVEGENDDSIGEPFIPPQMSKAQSFGPAFTQSVGIQNQGLTYEQIQKRDNDHLKLFRPPRIQLNPASEQDGGNGLNQKSPRFEIRSSQGAKLAEILDYEKNLHKREKNNQKVKASKTRREARSKKIAEKYGVAKSPPLDREIIPVLELTDPAGPKLSDLQGLTKQKTANDRYNDQKQPDTLLSLSGETSQKKSEHSDEEELWKNQSDDSENESGNQLLDNFDDFGLIQAASGNALANHGQQDQCFDEDDSQEMNQQPPARGKADKQLPNQDYLKKGSLEPIHESSEEQSNGQSNVDVASNMIQSLTDNFQEDNDQMLIKESLTKMSDVQQLYINTKSPNDTPKVEVSPSLSNSRKNSSAKDSEFEKQSVKKAEPQLNLHDLNLWDIPENIESEMYTSHHSNTQNRGKKVGSLVRGSNLQTIKGSIGVSNIEENNKNIKEQQMMSPAQTKLSKASFNQSNSTPTRTSPKRNKMEKANERELRFKSEFTPSGKRMQPKSVEHSPEQRILNNKGSVVSGISGKSGKQDPKVSKVSEADLLGANLANALKQQQVRLNSPSSQSQKGRQTHMMGLSPKFSQQNQSNLYFQEKTEVHNAPKICPADINFIRYQAATCKLQQVDIMRDNNTAESLEKIKKCVKSHLWAWGANNKHELAVNGKKIEQDGKQMGRAVWIPESIPLPTEETEDGLADIRVRQIAASDEHTAVVSMSGKLYTCGSYQHSKLGYQAPDNKHFLVQKDFVEVQLPSQAAQDQDKHEQNQFIVQAACGDHHTICINSQGEIYVWGGNLRGKRGDDPEKRPFNQVMKNGKKMYDLHVPCRIQSLIGKRIVQIACGQSHSLALDSAGVVYSWGDQSKAQCGYSEYDAKMSQLLQASDKIVDKPTPLNIFKEKGLKMQSIACGSNHSFAVAQNHQIYSWGFNEHGQCGISPPDTSEKSQKSSKFSRVAFTIHVPHIVYLPRDSCPCTHSPYFTHIEAGEHHSMILMKCKRTRKFFDQQSNDVTLLFTFGYNQHGQLGHGDITNYRQPKQIQFFKSNGLEDLLIRKVAAGRHHSLVLTDDGQVFGCGKTSHGELAFQPPSKLLKNMNQNQQNEMKFRFKTSNVLENGVTSFIPIYPVRKGMFDRIYAGGFHSFAVMSQVRSPVVPLDLVQFDSSEIVYTDTALAHRFLRFSVPCLKEDEEERGATDFSMAKIVQLFEKQLNKWKNPSRKDQFWFNEAILLDFKIQVDENIIKPHPKDPKKTQLLSSAYTEDNERQYLTISMVCDLNRVVNLYEEEPNSSMEDLRRPSETKEGQEVDKNIFKICENIYRGCYLSKSQLLNRKGVPKEVADIAQQVSVDKISIGTKISLGSEVTRAKLKKLFMQTDYKICQWAFELVHSIEFAIEQEKQEIEDLNEKMLSQADLDKANYNLKPRQFLKNISVIELRPREIVQTLEGEFNLFMASMKSSTNQFLVDQ